MPRKPIFFSGTPCARWYSYKPVIVKIMLT